MSLTNDEGEIKYELVVVIQPEQEGRQRRCRRRFGVLEDIPGQQAVSVAFKAPFHLYVLHKAFVAIVLPGYNSGRGVYVGNNIEQDLSLAV